MLLALGALAWLIAGTKLYNGTNGQPGGQGSAVLYLVGGTLASLIFEGDLDLSASGIIGAIIGTLIVLFVLERTGKI